jgi:predicted nucleic acid-binding protein
VILIDTSVLLAVAHVHHIHHEPSRNLWNQCSARETAVNTHVLAELYSTLTSMPKGFRLSPRNAMAAIDTFLQRVTPINLTPLEYVEAIRAASRLANTGGSIYDALHVACARKVNAEYIYTWNLEDFQLVAPDLAERIRTP